MTFDPDAPAITADGTNVHGSHEMRFRSWALAGDWLFVQSRNGDSYTLIADYTCEKGTYSQDGVNTSQGYDGLFLTCSGYPGAKQFGAVSLSSQFIGRVQVTKKILSVLAGTLFLAASAAAQAGSSGFSLGVGGGFAQADQGVGYTVLSTLEFPSPVRVVRPRLDVFYANWGRWPNVAGFTGNVLLTPFSTTRVAPYLLAGVGAYLEEDSNPKAGATFGFGLRLPGQLRSVVIESQAHVYLLDHPRGQIYAYTLEGPQYNAIKRARAIWKPIGMTIQF